MRNSRRVIRALEVCILTGKPFSSFRAEWSSKGAPRGIIVTLPKEKQVAAIEARTAAMFDEGVVGEVASVGEIGPTASQMIGLAEIRSHCAGKLTRGECIAAISQATRQYARRQLTWFRREHGLKWMDLTMTADPIGCLERMAANGPR
jgi:tRNA dimethylallyltransferase